MNKYAQIETYGKKNQEKKQKSFKKGQNFTVI